MTDRELMQQALDFIIETNRTSSFQLVPASRLNQVITALHKRLAQPEQELVCVCGAIWEGQELVSTPPPRQWQGLTDEEIGLLTTNDEWSHIETPVLALFARAIEAKLKEKNG